MEFEPGNGDEAWIFRVSDDDEVARFFVSKDKTGQTLAAVECMTSVEDWTLNRLKDQSKSMEGDVQKRLKLLDEMIVEYRLRIPPDNPSLLEVLAYLDSKQNLYTLEYLDAHQPGFFQHLVEHCREAKRSDVYAATQFERIMKLLKGRLLERILGPDNTNFVAKTLLEVI